MITTSAVSLTTMRAARLRGPRDIAIESVAVPVPQRGQVRVRIEGCGLCGSNLPVWQGHDWFSYPLEPGAPGHEGWGVIDALGDQVRGVSVGDRVTLLSHHAFAEYDIADASAVVNLPPALNGQPFPGEALGCAMNVFARCDLSRDHTVAIIGIGFLGGLLTQLASTTGARVIAVSRRPHARRVAQECGASETLPLEQIDDVARRIQQITNGRGCERVIEATGHQSALDLAGEILAVRGRLIIAGYHQDGPRQINLQQWNWRGVDVINAHERDPRVYVQGMRASIDAVMSGRIDPAPLYTHAFELHQLSDAFEMMRQRPEGFLKALVMP